MYFRFDIIYSGLVSSFKWGPNTSPTAIQYDSLKARQPIGQMNMNFMRFLNTEQWWRIIELSDYRTVGSSLHTHFEFVVMVNWMVNFEKSHTIWHGESYYS